MPLYEYLCNQCKQRVEIIQSIKDDPITVCPRCGGDVKKLISAPAIQFKGSGFYKTDYPSSTSSASTPSAADSSNATPSTAAPASGSSSSSSSDTTAAAPKSKDSGSGSTGSTD